MDYGRAWSTAESGGGKDIAAGAETSEGTDQRNQEGKLTRLGL